MSEKVSLIVTVYNEAQNIELLLSSIVMQEKKPDEVVIVDGGSDDQTVEIIKDYLKMGNLNKIKKEKNGFSIHFLGIDFIVLHKKGNRSIGRNYAIEKSSFDLIAVTDSGCILDKAWLAELTNKVDKADVVAGYYNSDPIGPFEEAVVPYVLVMPDQINPKTFLPATRSMMIRKDVFEELGGFNEKLSDNEDFAFAQKMKKNKVEIIFARKALVTWIPRSNIKDFWTMIMRFARGDIQAGIIRPKVLTIYLRYLVLIFSLLLITPLGIIGLITYLAWSILKNKKYVKEGWYYLPLLQIVSDFAVMWGSSQAIFSRLY